MKGHVAVKSDATCCRDDCHKAEDRQLNILRSHGAGVMLLMSSM